MKGTKLKTVNIKNTKKAKKSKTVWKKPNRSLTLDEQRRMFGKTMEMLLTMCMDNHCYHFNNEIRVQNKGGPIGLKLTGEIFDCVMIYWDKNLLAELAKLGLVPEIYTRFKDDITIVHESLEKGSKIIEGKIVIDRNQEELDSNKSGEKVTMGVIQEVANGILPMIQLTVETPCNFPDKKLPVLDVKVNVNTEENNRIDFEFFQKPTKHPKVILVDSALSFSKKRTILTQECLRILRNTKLELGQKVQKKYLDQFMLTLKNSGFSQKFRTEILDSAFKAFEKMKVDDQTGKKPMYRSRSWNFEERSRKKLEKRHNWWNSKNSKVKYTSVLFVTPTPGGMLLKDLVKREEELNRNSNERVKIVERGGRKIKDILCNKNPF